MRLQAPTVILDMIKTKRITNNFDNNALDYLYTDLQWFHIIQNGTEMIGQTVKTALA